MSDRAILLSGRQFDQGTIIDHGTEDAGFPVEHLQDPSLRTPWRFALTPPFDSHFVVDLGANPAPYDTFATLFANVLDGNSDTWRVRTGTATTGVGVYDSGVMPMWPEPIIGGLVGIPDSDHRAPEFYQPEGAHAWHHLGGNPDPEFVFVKIGSLNPDLDFGDVHELDRQDGSASIRFRSNADATAARFLVGKLNFDLDSAAAKPAGWWIALRPNFQGAVDSLEVGVSDGVTEATATFPVSVGSWHTVHMWLNQGGFLVLAVDDQAIEAVPVASMRPFNNSAPFTWGFSGSLANFADGTDLERVIVTSEWPNQTPREDILFNLMGIDLDGPAPLPPEVDSAWPLSRDDMRASLTRDIGPDAIQAEQVNNTSGGRGVSNPHSLFERYVRVDYHFADNQTGAGGQIGRFMLGEGLAPFVLHNSGTPTPVGAPPKLVNTWEATLTQDQRERIAYKLAFDRGSSPRVLRSWGGEVFPLDGAKTVAMCNDARAPDPWTRHQLTVYGYLDSISPITTIGRRSKGRTSITVRGM